MINFEKPLHEFTEEELQQRVNQQDPRFGALALYELQRRQQKENSHLVSLLVNEIKKLKKITDQNRKTAIENAKSDNRLARIAVVVAIIAVVTQVMFSVKRELRCAVSSHTPDYVEYSDCTNVFDLGIFGVHSFLVEDFVVPLQ